MDFLDVMSTDTFYASLPIKTFWIWAGRALIESAAFFVFGLYRVEQKAGSTNTELRVLKCLCSRLDLPFHGVRVFVCSKLAPQVRSISFPMC